MHKVSLLMGEQTSHQICQHLNHFKSSYIMKISVVQAPHQAVFIH